MNVGPRIVAFVLLGVLAGCGGGEPPEQADTEAVSPTTAAPDLLTRLTPEQEEGRGIYQSICWTCHGPGGRGNGPALEADTAGVPPNFIADGYADISAAELMTRFEAPLSGQAADPEHPHMRYVLSILKPERLRSALSYVPALAYPTEVPGSALSGMDLYVPRCAACHGDDGDGQGYAADALTVPPADFRTDTLLAAGDFEGLFQRAKEGGRAVHGSSMPPWGVALSDEQIWDLVAYVATFREGTLGPLPGGSP